MWVSRVVAQQFVLGSLFLVTAYTGEAEHPDRSIVNAPIEDYDPSDAGGDARVGGST